MARNGFEPETTSRIPTFINQQPLQKALVRLWLVETHVDIEFGMKLLVAYSV